jgi:hypothetical protein
MKTRWNWIMVAALMTISQNDSDKQKEEHSAHHSARLLIVFMSEDINELA